MSKTWKIVLGVLGVTVVAAGVAAGVYYYLNKKGKKPLAFFKSKFNSDGSVEAIDASDDDCDDCDDAVCAVDMCMPY